MYNAMGCKLMPYRFVKEDIGSYRGSRTISILSRETCRRFGLSRSSTVGLNDIMVNLSMRQEFSIPSTRQQHSREISPFYCYKPNMTLNDPMYLQMSATYSVWRFVSEITGGQ